MAWRFPREAARVLPAPAQLMLKRAKSTLRQDDWANSVSRLRRREQQYLDDTAQQNRQLAGSKRILFFSMQQVPPWVEVEYSLAAALRLRGHDVRGILCDGLVPLCEMNLGRVGRPPCEVCAGWLGRHEAAFGFEFSRLTAFLSRADRDLAREEVTATPDGKLPGLEMSGVAVGRIAERELQRYHRGFVFCPAADPAYREWLVSAVLLVRLAERLLDREQPHVVLCTSGRTLPSACLCAVARARGVRAVTWDTEPTFPDGLVFSHDNAAGLIPLDDAWAEVSRQPLTGDQRQVLREFLPRWAQRQIAPRPDNPALTDRQAIRDRLGLRPDAPMVVAFGNSAWDMAVVDRDVGFAGMFEWLFALVDHAAAHPEIDVVVRAHPAEINVAPDLQSRTPIVAEIRRRYGRLPGNLRLVDGAGPVDSYALADMARVVMVYASRIGLEVALGGKRPWLAGDTTYRGKGFTRDLTSRQHMADLLDAGVARDDDVLSPEKIELAERFAYLWFFRYVTRLPLLRPSTQPFSLETFRDLAPGGHHVIDRLCDAIVTGTRFLDL